MLSRIVLRRAHLFVLALAALATVVVVIAVARRSKLARTAATASSASPPRTTWTAGRGYRFSLHENTAQRATPPGGSTVEAGLRLDGDLVVRCHEVSGGKARVGLSLERLTHASLTVSGAEVLSTPDKLGGETFVWIDEHGAIEQALYRRDTTDALRAVMPNVIALMEVTLPSEPAASWTASELTLLGRARSQYIVGEGEGTLVRHRLGYEALLALPRGASAAAAQSDADDALSLDRDGVLETAKISERVTVAGALSASVEASLRRTETFTFSPAALNQASLEAHAPDERLARPQDTEEQRLRQLAGDMTMARLEPLALAATPGRALPPGFVTSAVAMLKLDPGLCGGLVEWFERPSTSLPARALLLDLLASAGHAKAQAAMRDALSSPAARQSPDGYRTLLQRLGVIIAPDKDTVAFAFGVYAKSTGEDRRAAAFALGATIGARGPARGDPALAAYGNRLRADLKQARSTDDRVALLAALGNAGRPGDVAVIRGLAHDDDARVRRQVALSLRRERTTDARDTLFTMLGDGDREVGAAALGALADEGATADMVRRLGAMVGTTQLPGALHEQLVTVVGGEMDAHPDEARAVLTAIAATSHDAHTIARARMLLERPRA